MFYNFPALKDESGEFILNGDWIIDWPGDYEGVGTTIVYQRHRNGSEDVKIDGPTDKILEVMVGQYIINTSRPLTNIRSASRSVKLSI